MPGVSSSEKSAPRESARPADRPHVVHVSIVHRADDVRVFSKECRSVAAAGYQVTLYARTDHLAGTDSADESGPEAAGRAGREPAAGRTIDGVRVVGVPNSGGRVRRMTVGVAGLLRPLLAERGQIYHFHDPELLPLAAVLRLLGRTVVYDAHEDLPAQVLGKQWIPARLRKPVAGLAWLLVRTFGRACNAVVAATPTVAAAYGEPGAGRVDLVHNYPVLVDGARFVPYQDRPMDLIYVGGISRLRGLDTMLASWSRVRERFPEARLHLVGPPLHDGLRLPPGPDQEPDPDFPGVIHHGLLPPEQARALMGSSRVGLAVLKRTRAHEDSIPNKLFEYLAESMPVVASDFPLWASIIADTNGGVVVDPDDPDAVADAVLSLLADPEAAATAGATGRAAVIGRYSWESEAKTLLSRYDALLRPGDGGSRRRRTGQGS